MEQPDVTGDIGVKFMMDFEDAKKFLPLLAEVMSNFYPETLDSGIVDTSVAANEM
jgi:hypothetical protein